MNTTIIAYNSLLYILTTLIMYKKSGINLMTALWIYFSFFSICSVLLLNDDLYYAIEGIDSGEKANITPYLLLYLSFLLITLPLRKFNVISVCIDESKYSNRRFHSIAKIAFNISVVYVIVKLIQISIVARIGFGIIHDMDSIDHIIYPGILGLIMKPLNLLGRVNNIVIMPMVVIYVLKGFTLKYFPASYTIRMITPYCIGTLIMGFVGGSRGAMFFGIMTLSFYVVLFYKYIPKKLFRRITLYATFLGFIIYTVMINITVERFGDGASTAVNDSILCYLGQMFPNITFKVWNHVSHPMGHRMFPFIWGEPFNDSDYWYYKCNIYGWNFRSLWGHFYEEFGVVISIFILIVYNRIINRYLSKTHFKLYDVDFVSMIYYVGIIAVFNFCFTSADYIGFILALVVARYTLNRKLY